MAVVRNTIGLPDGPRGDRSSERVAHGGALWRGGRQARDTSETVITRTLVKVTPALSAMVVPSRACAGHRRARGHPGAVSDDHRLCHRVAGRARRCGPPASRRPPRGAPRAAWRAALAVGVAMSACSPRAGAGGSSCVGRSRARARSEICVSEGRGCGPWPSGFAGCSVPGPLDVAAEFVAKRHPSTACMAHAALVVDARPLEVRAAIAQA